MFEEKCENGILTIYLAGHIDSNNAEEVEKELTMIRASHPDTHVVLDAEKLAYISSAGLRIILRIRKADDQLKIVNVIPDVYDVFEMTGFSEMMTVEKAYRRLSVDGCEILGEGSNGVVYRYDPETVIKVYRNPDALGDIQRERELARKALVLGIPTAIPFDVVKVGDKYASVFELLNAKSFSKLIKAEPENMDHYVQLFIDLLKQIHSTKVKATDMPNMKDVAVDWTEFLKEYLPSDQAEKLNRMVKNVPDRLTMLHGDYHTNNVEMQKGEVLLIDMDTLSYGHPIFELASMFNAFVGFGETDPEITEKFMKLPYETTKQIWAKSLRLYLDTEDEVRIKEVENKAMILGYARMLRRTIRRQKDTEEGQQMIAHYKKRLAELLPTVDTLEF